MRRTAAGSPDFSGLSPPVLVACSGGADSLALLALAADADLEPIAAHVDHGLRPESDHDARVVAAAAATLGARSHTSHVTVARAGNLEARAREARYAALEVARRQLGATAVLVAHTADDQAETVLLNLLRGAGTTGLGGMPARRGTIARPLLGVRRSTAREVCARRSLVAIDDPMNVDLAFRRVWLRREVIPMLEAGAARDLVPVLARQAALLHSDADLLDRLADDALHEVGGPETLDASGLAALPPAMARRVVRRWLGMPPPSHHEVDRVLAVARGERRATELSGSRRVARRQGRLAWHRAPGSGEARVALRVPGVATGLGLTLDTWVERAPPVRWPDGRRTAVLDADVAGTHAHLVRDTSAGPMLVDPGGEPLWSVGYGVTRRARVMRGTRRYLWVAVNDSPEHREDGP